MLAAIWRNAANIGSMRGEWKAWETVSGRVLTPSVASFSATARTVSRLPEMTMLSGPLIAAMSTSPRWGAIAANTRASNPALVASASSETIAPSWGSAPINRPRAATNFKPSAKLKTPATHAAAISPTLCPIKISGCTPHDCQSVARAYSRAKSAGWV